MRHFLLLLGLVYMTVAASADPLDPGTYPRTYVSSDDGIEQPYNLFVPSAAKQGEALPLVVALHGFGATWQSWFDATSVREWAEQEGYYVLCPQGRGNWFYLDKGERDVFAAIEDAKSVCHIDTDRIYLMGHSMGGWGTWKLATARPDYWAAIVPMSSWAPTNLLTNVEHLDPLIIHGDADDVVPIRFMELAIMWLTPRHISYRFRNVPGAGHESSMISDMLPEIGKWLEGRRRVECPTAIHHSAWTTTHGKAWWLTIRGITYPRDIDETWKMEEAEVHAEWRGEGHLFVYSRNASEITVEIVDGLLPFCSGEELLIETYGERFVLHAEEWRGKALLMRCNAPGMPAHGWSAEVVEQTSLTPVEPVFVGESTVDRDELLPRLARILTAGKTNAALLVTPTTFLPEWDEGPISVDDIVNLYVRPNDQLYTFEMDAEMLRELLMDQEGWKPSWWAPAEIYPGLDELDQTQPIILLAPGILGEKLEMSGRFPPPSATRFTLPSIRSIVYNHVLETGKF